MNTVLEISSSKNPVRYKSFHKKSNIIKLPEIVSPKNYNLKEKSLYDRMNSK